MLGQGRKIILHSASVDLREHDQREHEAQTTVLALNTIENLSSLKQYSQATFWDLRIPSYLLI